MEKSIKKMHLSVLPITLSAITILIAIYSVYDFFSGIRNIFPLSSSGYIYIIRSIVILTALIILAIYLRRCYGKRVSRLYNIAYTLLLIYTLIPLCKELIYISDVYQPDMLTIMQTVAKIIMTLVIVLIIIENQKERENKFIVYLYGFLFSFTYLAIICSTSYWVTGSFSDMNFYIRTVGVQIIKEIHFLPFIITAFCCSKNHFVLKMVNEKKIKEKKAKNSNIKE